MVFSAPSCIYSGGQKSVMLLTYSPKLVLAATTQVGAKASCEPLLRTPLSMKVEIPNNIEFLTLSGGSRKMA